ncbi:MAG: hypothetical protein K2N63_06805 [Lachnospiraceae bacterium]|nr:hypothetical protein [Lachnospiraceae bacterium]
MRRKNSTANGGHALRGNMFEEHGTMYAKAPPIHRKNRRLYPMNDSTGLIILALIILLCIIVAVISVAITVTTASAAIAVEEDEEED